MSACCLLAGCGSSKDDSLNSSRHKYTIENEANNTEAAAEDGAYLRGETFKAKTDSKGMSASAASDSAEYDISYDEDAVDMENVAETMDSNNSQSSNSNKPVNNLDANKVSKEMLVFRGSISLDTLEFNDSVDSFKKLLEDNGGFVFSERYTDNARKGNDYIIEEEEKKNVYTATVRVPSSNYDALMNGTGGLGDVREKNTEVTNLTQQYSTYKSQLEIYEKEYKRYMDMLEKATSDSESKEIQNKLFDLELDIANLKTGMGDIEMDVAYSYIDVTIREVEEYVEEEDEIPEEEKTFSDKIKEAFDDAVADFKDGIQDILIGIVSNLFAFIITAVFILVFVIFIIVANKKHKKKKALLADNNQANVANQNINNMPMVNGQMIKPEMNPEITMSPNVDNTNSNNENVVNGTNVNADNETR